VNSGILIVPPLLPYFALILRDLTFINEGNPKYFTKGDETNQVEDAKSEDSSHEKSEQGSSEEENLHKKDEKDGAKEIQQTRKEINWELMVMLNQVRLVLHQYQRNNYCFVPNHELRRILSNLNFISNENELWNLSQTAYPSNREKKSHRRSSLPLNCNPSFFSFTDHIIPADRSPHR